MAGPPRPRHEEEDAAGVGPVSSGDPMSDPGWIGSRNRKACLGLRGKEIRMMKQEQDFFPSPDDHFHRLKTEGKQNPPKTQKKRKKCSKRKDLFKEMSHCKTGNMTAVFLPLMNVTERGLGRKQKEMPIREAIFHSSEARENKQSKN